MRLRSSLPVALVVAALGATGCGASSDDQQPTVTMDRAAAAAVAHAEAVAEGGESLGYETVKRERCKRLHPNAPCRIEHVKLRNH